MKRKEMLYPTEVIVTLQKDGLLSVVLPDFQRPYMSLQDSMPSHSDYVGFASCGNANTIVLSKIMNFFNPNIEK